MLEVFPPEEVLKKLEKKVKELDRARKKCQKEHNLKKQKEKKERDEYIEWQVKQIPNTLLKSTEILNWVNEFLKKTELVEKLKKIFKYSIIIYTTYDFQPTLKEERWPLVYLGISWKKKQLFKLAYGCGAKTEFVKSPEAIFKDFDPRLIDELHQHLTSGAVWQAIVRDLAKIGETKIQKRAELDIQKEEIIKKMSKKSR